MQKDTKLISFDTSPSDTGWAAYINGSYSKSGHIKIKPEKMWKPYELMLPKLLLFIEKEKPDIIVIETPVVIRNAETQRELDRIIGAIQAYCLCKDIDFREMRPTEWRKWCLVEQTIQTPKKKNRDAWKNWSIETATKIMGKSFNNDNESDAALLGLAYINWFFAHIKQEKG